MKRHGFFLTLPFFLVLVLVATSVPNAEARRAPQGRYEGTATGLKLKEELGTTRHPDTRISIQIPNPGGTSNVPGGPRGRFNGNFFVAGNSFGFIFNIPINGRIQKSEIRRGGRKFLIDGKWKWRLDRNRLDKRATGKFKLQINRVIDNGAVTWVMSGPIRLSSFPKGNAEQMYRYTGRFKATNQTNLLP